MSGLKITLDPSSSIPNQPLKDDAFDLIGGTASYQAQPSLKGITFGLDVEANSKIFVFNSLDDKDDEGAIGKPVKTDTGFGEVTLPPQITLTDQQAWLKYRVLAKAKVSATGTISPAEFKIDASKQIIFADYHFHARTENTREAVAKDIPNIRFAANPDDAMLLETDEALAYAVRGELNASVTLSWSDVFTWGLTSLTQFLKAGQLLGIKVSADASVSFNLAVVDDFRLVLTQPEAGTIRVAVKKADSREVGIKASISVSAQFSNPKDLEDAVGKIYESLLGRPVADIDTILRKATFGDLSDAERQIVNEVINRLGFGDVVHTLQDLKDRWDAAKQEVQKVFKQVAESKVEAGFAYEYLRTSEDDTLLIADLPEADFRRAHNDLILCDISSTLSYVKANPAALKNYLHQNTLKRSQAWGFSLGIGQWKFSGKDKKELDVITQNNISGQERLAYLGMRSYEANTFGNKESWTVDFNAQMSAFASAPATCDFGYGLHFQVSCSEKKLDGDKLREFLDFAVIWRVLSASTADEVVKQVAADLKKAATVQVEFVIEDEQLRKLLGLATTTQNLLLGAHALAKALPYMKDYDGRRSPSLRDLCYSGVWLEYLRDKNPTPGQYVTEAADAVSRMTQLHDEAALAFYEKLSTPGSPAYYNPYTFGGQIYLQGNPISGDYTPIASNWQKFVDGLTRLAGDINPATCASKNDIPKVFASISAFLSQWLYVRAAGAYLMDLAATDDQLFRDVKRACTISFDGGNAYKFGASIPSV